MSTFTSFHTVIVIAAISAQKYNIKWAAVNPLPFIQYKKTPAKSQGLNWCITKGTEVWGTACIEP